MAVDVVMPQMGESVVEGTVAKWLVKEGGQVAEDQPIGEIPTDKVDTELPSPATGRVMKIAAERRVDLTKVKGTGLGGRVTKRDVQNYLDSLTSAGAPAPAPLSPPSAGGPATRPATAADGVAIRAYTYQPRQGDRTEP